MASSLVLAESGESTQLVDERCQAAPRIRLGARTLTAAKRAFWPLLAVAAVSVAVGGLAVGAARRPGSGGAAPAREAEAVGLQGVWPPVGPADLDKDAMVDIVECGLDVGQMIYRLTAAATSIRGAKYACAVTETEAQKAACSAATSAIIYSFIFVATTVSQAVTDCAHKVNAPAVCTTVVTGMIANLGTIARSASSLTNNCHLPAPPPLLLPFPLWPHGNETKWAINTTAAPTTTNTTTTPAPTTTTAKPYVQKLGAKAARLAGGAKSFAANSTIAVPLIPKAMLEVAAVAAVEDKAKADYQTAIVNCWVFVGQAAANLARASIGISEAATKCTPEAYGSNPSELTQKKCAVNIVGLLGGLGWAASFLAAAVPQCGGPGHMEAQCAADIAGLAAAVFAATAPAMQLRDQCVDLVNMMKPK